MKSMERKVLPSSEYYLYTPSRTAQRLFFYPLQCGLFTYEPGYRLSRSSFDSYLLMYVQQGTLELDLNGRLLPVHERQFALINCYEPHGYATETGYECIWLHFDGPMASAYYQAILAQLGNVFTLEDAFPVLRRLNNILHLFQEDQPIREPLLSKYINDILTELLLFRPGHTGRRSESETAEIAIRYINEHFSEDLSLEQLAAQVGLSPYYFIRVFRRETGYTPHDYLTSRRMASARYLLKYTELTVKEICFHCGFSGESVFCNAFKKQHGMTPQRYRLGEAPEGS